MKNIFSPRKSCIPLMSPGLRLGFPFIITFLVISSPIVMFINPVFVAASTSSDGSASAPSTISQDGSDFRAQAALSGVAARQTNDIVNTNAYYDIIFNTATTAAIKEIRVTFPAGTDVSIARLVEAEGIGKGVVGPGTISGQTVRYVVPAAGVTTIPAGTQIRIELSNIVNPSSPGNGFTVTVETRGTTNNIIDGPTQSFAYPIKQIGTGQIADNAVTGNKIAGTDKLIFGTCTGSLPVLAPGGFSEFSCSDVNADFNDEVVALWTSTRSIPAPVFMNSVINPSGFVAFGFENPSSVNTASQDSVVISYIIFNKSV
jgi:hypothetical protein